MVETLSVHLSRDELHAVEPEPTDFETDGTFQLELVNHGRAAHVHVHPDDALARGVTVEESNFLVETESKRIVEVSVPAGPRPFGGSLDVSAGYGAGEASLDVTVVESTEPDLPVDETLAEPQRSDTASAPSVAAFFSEEGLPVLALGVVALGIAVAAAWTIGDPVVTLGAVVVLGGVAAAVYALATE